MWLLWILSLPASFPLLATGEVVSSFKPCSQFFLGGKPPTLRPMNPARICQFYRGKYRFATMYDRDRRIPIFSAYKYQPGGTRRRKDWKIEPQLALPKERKQKSMELEKTCKIDHELLENSQALSKDYKQATPYDRGHLLPVSHQPDRDGKAATFTLTNIVPQFRQLNHGKWAEYERNMKKDTIGCQDTYVIVGVVPGKGFLTGHRVNIPSYIWAAACCVSQSNQRRSWAVVAKNSENEVYPGTLRQLEILLGKCYGKNINLFNGACYSGNTPQNNFTEQMQLDYKPSNLLAQHME